MTADTRTPLVSGYHHAQTRACCGICMLRLRSPDLSCANGRYLREWEPWPHRSSTPKPFCSLVLYGSLLVCPLCLSLCLFAVTGVDGIVTSWWSDCCVCIARETTAGRAH